MNDPKYDFVKNLKGLSVRFTLFVILLERGLDAGFKLWIQIYQADFTEWMFHIPFKRHRGN